MRISKVNLWAVVSIIVILLTFIFSFIILFDKNNILNSFLNAAAIAGFFGMFIQFVLSIIQTIYEERGEKICFIAKNSPFSNRILNGIMTATLNEVNVTLTPQLMASDVNIDVNENLNRYIEENIKNFDGFIIRIEKDNERTRETLRRLDKYKIRYVLVDKKIHDSTRSQDGCDPAFVSSDFAAGGILIGKKIVEYCKEKVNSDPKILVLSNRENDPSRKRTDAIVGELDKEGYKYEKIVIDSFDEIKAVEKLLNHKDFAKADVIYCSIDEIALKLMKKMRIENVEYNSNVLFVGYDGIKDGEIYKLDYYGYNYITVDTTPEEQGKKAYELLKLKSDLNNVKEKLIPILVEKGECENE